MGIRVSKKGRDEFYSSKSNELGAMSSSSVCRRLADGIGTCWSFSIVKFMFAFFRSSTFLRRSSRSINFWRYSSSCFWGYNLFFACKVKKDQPVYCVVPFASCPQLSPYPSSFYASSCSFSQLAAIWRVLSAADQSHPSPQTYRQRRPRAIVQFWRFCSMSSTRPGWLWFVFCELNEIWMVCSNGMFEFGFCTTLRGKKAAYSFK